MHFFLLFSPRQSFLQGLGFHKIVSAGCYSITIFKFDQAGIHLAARNHFAGRQVSFGKAGLHAPNVPGHVGRHT